MRIHNGVAVNAGNANISREQMALFVRDKKTLYNAAVANGFVLPRLKQAIVTIKFLFDVRAGKLWAPKAEDITKCVLVAQPPTRKILAAAI